MAVAKSKDLDCWIVGLTFYVHCKSELTVCNTKMVELAED